MSKCHIVGNHMSRLIYHMTLKLHCYHIFGLEVRSGLGVECLNGDRGVAGLSLTGGTALGT